MDLRPVWKRQESSHWNELIHRYHYLGYKALPGTQIRYFVHAGRHLVALLGFGVFAWKVTPRDRFIGWESDERRQKLHLVVNNARFLILPWIHRECLASRTLVTGWIVCQGRHSISRVIQAGAGMHYDAMRSNYGRASPGGAGACFAFGHNAAGAVEAVPRHSEVADKLARKICRGLGVPDPGK